MKKKYLYIIIGIIIILILGFFLAAFVIMQRGTTGDGGAGGLSNPFANFFPFGQPVTPSEQDGETPGTEQPGETPGKETTPVTGITGLLRQISNTPTAGMLPILKQNEVYVDYIEKETGNIFETKLSDMTQIRLSNVLIPRIHEAFLGNNGKNAILRSLDTDVQNDVITSFALDVTNPAKPNNIVITDASSTPESKPNGVYLMKNILDPIVSKDTKNIFFLTNTSDFTTRKTLGTIYNFEKGTFFDVFLSQFSDWLPVMFNGDTIVMQTKASQRILGYAYSLDTKSGTFQRILGDISGLTVLPSPNNQKILYSESTASGIRLHLYNKVNNSTLDISEATFPEKCVWKSDSSALYCAIPNYIDRGAYPDDWYQGSVSFADNIWKIDANTGNITSIVVPQSRVNQYMDITNLMLSTGERYLVFINKKDSTLWMYDLIGTE